MARANKSFDEKVRQYVINHHINHFRNIDELYPKRRCQKTIVHELFPGNDTRKRCIYVNDCMFFLSIESHVEVHASHDKTIDLLMNRIKSNDRIAAENYYDRLRLLVNTFDMKKTRYLWREFFDGGCVGAVPLLNIEKFL